MTKSPVHIRFVLYVFCALLAMPPGFGTSRLFAADRNSTFTRDSVVESYRNPQLSSGQWNRFLYADKPGNLVADGSSEWATPASTGFGKSRSPKTLWLTNNAYMEWAETDSR